MRQESVGLLTEGKYMDKHPKTHVPDKPKAHQQKLQQAAIHLTNAGKRKATTNTQEVMGKPER